MYFWLLVILTSILIICRWHYHHLVTNMGLGEHWLFVWYVLLYQWWGRITCVYSDFQLVFFITIRSYVAIWLVYLLLPNKNTDSYYLLIFCIYLFLSPFWLKEYSCCNMKFHFNHSWVNWRTFKILKGWPLPKL